MRLLHVDSLDINEFRDEDAPPYVAASHRWLSEGETTYQDARDRRDTGSAGYLKVEAFAKYIRGELAPIKWLWIDTACINKQDDAELAQAIHSMFRWYRRAQLCLAYLADVSEGYETNSIESSVWWTRGWTLQELLAPRTVVFVTKEWQVVGHKGSSACGECQPRHGIGLEKMIARITGVPEQVLHDFEASYGLSVEEKRKWMDGRSTTRPEDMPYALFGILGVTLPVIYGETQTRSRERLLTAPYQRAETAALIYGETEKPSQKNLLATICHRDDTAALIYGETNNPARECILTTAYLFDDAAVQLAEHQAKHYRTVVDWLAPPDPWTNHESARQRHEPGTSAWLLHTIDIWLGSPDRAGRFGCMARLDVARRYYALRRSRICKHIASVLTTLDMLYFTSHSRTVASRRIKISCSRWSYSLAKKNPVGRCFAKRMRGLIGGSQVQLIWKRFYSPPSAPMTKSSSTWTAWMSALNAMRYGSVYWMASKCS
ncbi:hypothetical protein LTR56_008268 [Elasticomyces elasticus]|nr:hypothetical protein LTR56_008268 [Elasticomyces elasticus]KAK3661831.1 hypothetical protein LTR22_007414 [Elasticomyces elasticus]KAK4924435.1 hypothetical protein LTR49_008526 [Elasticomyces elasticus]KAK5762600.1 hypothetical protein LTS12_007190 [Elasticomyces elasticus]